MRVESNPRNFNPTRGPMYPLDGTWEVIQLPHPHFMEGVWGVFFVSQALFTDRQQAKHTRPGKLGF